MAVPTPFTLKVIDMNHTRRSWDGGLLLRNKDKIPDLIMKDTRTLLNDLQDICEEISTNQPKPVVEPVILLLNGRICINKDSSLKMRLMA